MGKTKVLVEDPSNPKGTKFARSPNNPSIVYRKSKLVEGVYVGRRVEPWEILEGGIERDEGCEGEENEKVQ